MLSIRHATHKVVYGITRLTAQEAGPKRLFAPMHPHWRIENVLHCRHDETLREDWCYLKQGNASRAMAVISNLIVGLGLQLRWTNLAMARRYFDVHPHKAQHMLLLRLS